MIGFGVELSPRIGGGRCIPGSEMLGGHLQMDLMYVLDSDIILN